MSFENATPRPWAVWSEENADGTEVSVCHVRDVAKPYEHDDEHKCAVTAKGNSAAEAKANAELISRAVNSFEEMLIVLVRCRRVLKECLEDPDEHRLLIVEVDAIIEKAEKP